MVNLRLAFTGALFRDEAAKIKVPGVVSQGDQISDLF